MKIVFLHPLHCIAVPNRKLWYILPDYRRNSRRGIWRYCNWWYCHLERLDLYWLTVFFKTSHFYIVYVSELFLLRYWIIKFNRFSNLIVFICEWVSAMIESHPIFWLSLNNSFIIEIVYYPAVILSISHSHLLYVVKIPIMLSAVGGIWTQQLAKRI